MRMRAPAMLGCMALVTLAFAAGNAADATEIQLKCKHELADKHSLWVFDTANHSGFFDDGKLKSANVVIAGNQITVKQTEEQPICHVGKGCTDGKQVTEFTTVINRTTNTYLVYCRNVHDDGANWKPGQNCFPKGPNKGTCARN